MSLINDILKDIENKPDSDTQSVLGVLQSASVKKKSNPLLPRLLAYGAILVLLGAGYWAYMTYFVPKTPTIRPLGAGTSPQVNEVQVNQAKSQAKEQAKQPAVVPVRNDSTPVAEAEPVTIKPAQESVSPEPVVALEQKMPLEPQTEVKPRVEPQLVSSDLVEPKASSTAPVKNEPSQNAAPKTVVPKSAAKSDAPKAVSAQKQTAPSKEAVAQQPLSEAKDGATSVSKRKTLEVQSYEKALSEYQAGRFLSAEQLTDQLLAEYQDPRYVALKARVLLQRSPASLVAYIDKENIDTASSDELLALAASAYQRSGDHIRAVQSYDLLVQRQPAEGRWWLAMAFSLESGNALEKALKAYSLALQAGTLPANAREFAAKKANQLNKQLQALAEQAKEQK